MQNNPKAYIEFEISQYTLPIIVPKSLKNQHILAKLLNLYI